MGVLIGKELTFKHEFNNTFKDAYNKNPKKTLRLMEMCISELGYELDEDLLSGKVGKIHKFLSKEKNRLTLYAVVGAVLGICSFESFMMFLFGGAFFLAGHFVTLFVPKTETANVIFLFSHGLTGLVVMYFSFIGVIFQYVLASKFYTILFAISIMLSLSGFIRTFLIRLSTIKLPYKDTVFIYYLAGIFVLAIIRILVFIETGGVINAI